MTAVTPDLLRGFVVRATAHPDGWTGLIRDIAGNEYLLTPTHWLDKQPASIGLIVEFEPQVVDKGRLAKRIQVISTNSMLADKADKTWFNLANDETKQQHQRQAIYRLRYLVFKQGATIEEALHEIYGVTYPDALVLPTASTEADFTFLRILSRSKAVKDKHETAKRLCYNLGLDYSRLLGFLRGSISYRVALELTHRQIEPEQPMPVQTSAPVKKPPFKERIKKFMPGAKTKTDMAAARPISKLLRWNTPKD